MFESSPGEGKKINLRVTQTTDKNIDSEMMIFAIKTY